MRPNGSYWGAGGEQIDMLSGNLNFTLPLLQGKGRGGLSATLALNYNSQVWRKDDAGNWCFGKDLGYGFGWRLMLGSITPYWSDWYTLHHYIYTDASGAEYRLDVNSGNVWRSKDSIYLWYDANTTRLYFRDGTFWVMGAISAGTEQDAGTRYPTLIQDTNGNQIVVEYKTGLGVSWTNSSARVYEVRDVRNAVHAYRFNYNTDAIPHLTSVQNYIGTSEGYTFAYSAEQPLYSPFTPSTQFGTTRMLNSVTTAGINLTHQFAYGDNGSGELTQLTFPYGGFLRWMHASLTLSGGRTHREVQNRYLAKSASATETQHILYRDPGDVNRTIHVGVWLADIGAPGMKKWGFLWSGTGAWYDGLQQHYEEMPAHWTSPGTRLQAFTWAQDAGSNPYISVATITLNPGQSYEKVSKVEQTLDTNGWGNVLWTKIYNYGDLVTPAQTYTNTYFTDTNHTDRYIRNRLLTTQLTSGAQSMTLVTNTYGGSYQGLTDITNPGLHDTAYGTSFGYRGNLVSRTVPGKPTGYLKYDIVGNVTKTTDTQGHTVDLTTTSATSYTAPSLVTPNSNTNLASSFTYTSFLGIATATAPNASTSSYTYDGTARPTSTTSPHGAVTNYTYNDSPLPAFEKVTTNGKWVKKTKDGLGRVVLVEAGYGTTTVSMVTTEYAPCSCSPLGRVWRVSQPYTTTPTAWTTYSYDALGRTTCVSLPGNSGSTTYTYTGNIVRVSDPKLHWKEYQTDVFGNVTKVTEEGPQGGANHETTYAYDMFNRLTTVTMPRSGTTQTRTFAYNTLGQLQSTVNPENGATTLAYNTDGSLFSKTDQKTQRIEYSYDSFRRVSQVRKYLPGYQTDDPCQRVNYYYDTNPYESWFTQNGWGRLAVVEYGQPSCTGGQYRESYSYTSGGLPVKKKLWVYDGSYGTGSLVGEWSYDSEGKILTVKYPDTYDSQGNPLTGRTYTNGYDSMGRLSTLVDNRPGDPPGWTWVSAATYNAAGQLTYMTGWNALSETRQYNERLQLTQIQQNGPTIQYYYPDAQNNDGRITRQVVSGVEKAYTYDSLGRLSTAGSSSYTYDGFGNRLQQTSPAVNLTYNASNNRITTTGYSYDNNGNLTTMPNLTMTYDVENRLAEAQTQNGTERYRYAPSGQRVWKQKPLGPMEWYFYGVDGRLIGTYVPCQYYGTLFQEQSTNVYFGGRTLQAQGQTGMKQDRLGTTSYTATAYAPYGDTGILPPPYGDGLGFTGYYRDGTTTGLDYAQQRYYAPSIGRFTSADPYMPSAAVARPQSWNRYAYVENNPVNFTDPSGLYIEWCDGWACSSAGGGIGWSGGGFTGSPFDGPFVPGPSPLPGGGSPGDGGGGGASLTGNMRARLASKIQSLRGSNCEKVLTDKAITSLEGLQERSDSMNYYSATAQPNVTLGSILNNRDSTTLSDYAAREMYKESAAITLTLLGPGPGGTVVTPNVVLTSNFDAADDAGKGLVLLHEALHYYLQMNDKAMRIPRDGDQRSELMSITIPK